MEITVKEAVQLKKVLKEALNHTEFQPHVNWNVIYELSLKLEAYEQAELKKFLMESGVIK